MCVNTIRSVLNYYSSLESKCFETSTQSDMYSVIRNHEGLTNHYCCTPWPVLTFLAFPVCHYQSLGSVHVCWSLATI